MKALTKSQKRIESAMLRSFWHRLADDAIKNISDTDLGTFASHLNKGDTVAVEFRRSSRDRFSISWKSFLGK